MLRVWSLACACLVIVGSAEGQVTTRVSVDSAGAQGDGASSRGSISADGRYVAFDSAAPNLVAGDTNGTADIFVHDRQSGATSRVSLSSSGAQGNGGSNWTLISADGRFVAFQSLASNLVAGDTNGTTDIFVHDRQSGATSRASLSSSGAQGNGESYYASISADGRFVAFYSYASNLVAGDTNGTWDVFVHDRQSGATSRVSLSSSGAQGNDGSYYPSISADGNFVAFHSWASNLVAGDTNGTVDILVHDRQSGATSRVSLSSSGAQGNGWSELPSISVDGRFVAFTSGASNLVADDTSGTADIFVHDRQSGATSRVSLSSSGAQSNGGSDWASISADGRFVAFHSWASDLVAGDTNGNHDVFVHDRQGGATSRVSLSSSGAQGSSGSFYPSISADGRFVAFGSSASNLVAGDTNGFWDVFVHDRAVPAPVPFCFGDGGATPCPCGNAGAAGNGCANSGNALGANLAASGLSSLSWDTAVLTATGMPSRSALYFQGTTRANGGAGTAFGDGLRCTGGELVRLATVPNLAGVSWFPQAGTPGLSARGWVGLPATRTYQVWYRDAAAFCTRATFNLTNGVELTWVP